MASALAKLARPSMLNRAGARFKLIACNFLKYQFRCEIFRRSWSPGFLNLQGLGLFNLADTVSYCFPEQRSTTVFINLILWGRIKETCRFGSVLHKRRGLWWRNWEPPFREALDTTRWCCVSWFKLFFQRFRALYIFLEIFNFFKRGQDILINLKVAS